MGVDSLPPLPLQLLHHHKIKGEVYSAEGKMRDDKREIKMKKAHLME